MSPFKKSAPKPVLFSTPQLILWPVCYLFIAFLQVFLKYWHSEQLDICLDRCHKQVLRSQCYIRGWMARRRARSRRQLAQKQYNIMTCFLTLVEQAGHDKFESLRGLVAHDQIQFEKKVSIFCVFLGSINPDDDVG